MKLKWRWKKLSNSAYEAYNGVRVHCGGQLIKVPDRDYISGFELPHRIHLPKLRYIMGGNWKRALLLYAEQTIEISDN